MRCKKQKRLYDIEYRSKNKDKLRTRQKEYQLKNKDKIRSYKKAYQKRRYEEDTNFKLTNILRSRLSIAIKKGFKSGSAVSDLGCSIEEFKLYIEAQFKSGMTWDNWSREGWSLDHIIPLASFDLTDREQLLKACHYTNLQPMWARDNESKGSKII